MSLKSRKTAKTQCALHALAKPSELPSIIKPQIPTNRLKDSLTANFAQKKPNPFQTTKNKTNFMRVELALEIARYHALALLRKSFVKICSKYSKSITPVYCFDRWLAVQLMNDIKRLDLLIPYVSSPVTQSLTTDLERIGISTENAESICNEIKQFTNKQSQILENQKKSKDNSSCVVQLDKYKHSIDLKVANLPKLIIKINHSHFDKLAKLFIIHSKADHPNFNPLKDLKFRTILFCLLLRYRSLGADGFQAGLSTKTFTILKNNYDVEFECFASPLNCTFANYGSLFPDIDSYFGSFGSFFDWNNELDSKDGYSFEANPPFIPEIMLEMTIKIDKMLSLNPSCPLSFVVIVPIWKEAPSYSMLKSSLFLQKTILIHKDAHGFTDGAQHKRQDRYRESPFDTAVFILQNKPGTLRWPGSKSVEDEIRSGFMHGMPTVMERKRRVRDARGVADLDGGGGVYRGKKRNKHP
jgi:phosphorylated CTD-interacting factor 1